MTPQFAFKKNSDGQEIELRPTMSVGKLDTSDIVLRDGLPSRHHAKLNLERDELYVEDLQSRNGTFVNGLQISARTRLYGGDKVRFDVEEFAVIGPPRPDLPTQDQATICRPPPAAATPVPDPVTARTPKPAAASTPASATAPPPAAAAPKAAPPAPTPRPAPAPTSASAAATATPAASTPASTPASASASAPAAAPEAAAAAPSPARRDAAPKAADRRPPAWLEPGDASGKTKFVKRTAGPRRSPGADSSTDVLDVPVAPESVQVPTLLIISGSCAGRRFPLEINGEAQQEWTIGSDSSNSIALPDPEISATHAVIRREAKQWKIIDKFSTNGTFVNKQSTVTRVLAASDRLQFGPVETQLLLPAAGMFDAIPWSGTGAASSAAGSGKGRILWWAVGGFVLMLIAIGVAVKFFL